MLLKLSMPLYHRKALPPKALPNSSTMRGFLRTMSLWLMCVVIQLLPKSRSVRPQLSGQKWMEAKSMVLTAWLGMKSWPVSRGQPMLFVTGLVLHYKKLLSRVNSMSKRESSEE